MTLLYQDDEVETFENVNERSFKFAAQIGSFDILVKYLFETLEDVEEILDHSNVAKYSPLFYAAWHGHVEVVKLLECIEFDRNPKMSLNVTPLHLATKNGHARIVELLLKKFPGDENPKDYNGKTPMDMAKTEEIRYLFYTTNSKQII